MTFYAGEEFKIVSTPTEWGTNRIFTDTQVADMKITVVDATSAVIVDHQDMTFLADDPDLGTHWYYVWNTAGLDPGTYKAQVKLTGFDGGENYEYKRIRLSKNQF